MNQEINEIKPGKSVFDLKLKEIWQYRDLLILFIRREIVVVYKQTILGPLWYIIQPILTTIMFTIVFGRVAGISTDGVPKVLFYLAGITAWNYFSESLRLTSDTFTKNADIFGKVYFPRSIMPIAVVFSNLVKFIIQLVLFLGFYSYFKIIGSDIHGNLTILLLPLYVLITAGLGLGFGLVISALTTKYRDLKFLIQFGVQLWMYATPVIYPISSISEKYQWLVLLNPMTSIVEAFKYAFIGKGLFTIEGLLYSSVFMIVILVAGIVIFNRTEKNFMDTV